MNAGFGRRDAAFTLLEVLVALAIFATVAAVVLTAAGRSLNNAARLEEVTFAGWIADNRLTELQLTPSAPAIGRQDAELDYAGRRWALRSEVEETEEPGLLRVTVWVATLPAEAGVPIEERAVTQLTGFVETGR
ncbi:type II secretion system minor pseudopilin GspI [Stutzerimonas urumqiensis]|uniref:type II secretion system minor pseudopilin GspI n=1 Tax=Stutzerimonas urumqiensis TaxID=638269 RepID=UPI003DA23FDA